ncbi:hypothetical protein PG993_003013 [Apiospora rasikravindrae]|uniref:FAD-binding domain-containing protein n=1 Tax=Apiospora rasikravindrae TaxID=990691 RepID=A0ABR1TY93_9PEZI
MCWYIQSQISDTQRCQTLHIAIVGAGIGGLTCAIACRRLNKNLKATVLERSAEVLPLGAGIHIPPNAGRVLAYLDLLDRVKKEAGGYQLDNFTLRRYKDGRALAEKPVKERVGREYGAEWM